jgi:hypothetical protein
MEDEKFFVGIYDPLDVRRNLLESSKEVVKAMQAFETIEKTREEKLKLFREMNFIMKELDVLVTKLKARLPKSHLRKALDEPVKRKVPRVSSKFSSELEKLEEQLKMIERELSVMK